MPLRARHLVLAAAVAGTLAACATAPREAAAPAAEAEAAAGASVSTATSGTVNLASASGSLVSGTLQLTPVPGGVRFTGEIGGLGKGATHAIHIHEKGDCSAADASSAGGHFNPESDPHGRAGREPHHAGDMDNLVADSSGVARVDVRAYDVTLGGGAANDIAGKAVIVHAQADDYTSQPSGNAGARVACGVIQAR